MSGLEDLVNNLEVKGLKGISKEELENRTFDKSLVCVGYSKNLYSDQKVLAYVIWAAQHSNKVVVLIGDSIIAYNLQYWGFTEEHSRYLALEWGAKRKKELEDLLSDRGLDTKATGVLLSEVAQTGDEKREYQTFLGILKDYSKDSEDFRKDSMDTLPRKLKEKVLGSGDRDEHEKLIDYALEQLTFCIYLAKRGHYPKIGNIRERLYDRILMDIFENRRYPELFERLDARIKPGDLSFVYVGLKTA